MFPPTRLEFPEERLDLNKSVCAIIFITITSMIGNNDTATLIDNQYGVFTQEKRFVGPNGMIHLIFFISFFCFNISYSAVWLSDFDRTKPSEKGNITFGAAFPNAQVHVLTVELVSYTYVDTLPDGLQRSGVCLLYIVFNILS